MIEAGFKFPQGRFSSDILKPLADYRRPWTAADLASEERCRWGTSPLRQIFHKLRNAGGIPPATDGNITFTWVGGMETDALGISFSNTNLAEARNQKKALAWFNQAELRNINDKTFKNSPTLLGGHWNEDKFDLTLFVGDCGVCLTEWLTSANKQIQLRGVAILKQVV